METLLPKLGRTLVHKLAAIIANEEAKTLGNALGDVQAEPQVNTVADTLSDGGDQALGIGMRKRPRLGNTIARVEA